MRATTGRADRRRERIGTPRARRGSRLGLAFAGVLLALAGVACQGTGERLVVPTPKATDYSGMELSAVFALSREVIYLGGRLDSADGGVEGIVLRSDDSGAHWRRVGSETVRFRGVIVQDIHFSDARRGWIAGIRVTETGTNAVVLATKDGGGHWREHDIAEPRAEFISHLQNLDFASDTLGTVDVVYLDAETSSFVANSYRTSDAGRTWVIGAFRDDVAEESADLGTHFSDADQGYRIGAPEADGSQILWRTATGGQSWREVTRFDMSRFDAFYGPWDRRADPPDPDAAPVERAARR
ncbi:MAG: hypothetical protein R3F20_14635 [Planctomycetota bacterium]